jgi:lipoprotein-anchoring transpeptidase ErfK/SrfK
LRASISGLVVAFAVIGFVGKAAAQSYPPPIEYEPEPPAPYPVEQLPPDPAAAPLPPPGAYGPPVYRDPYGPPRYYDPRYSNYDPRYGAPIAEAPPPYGPYYEPQGRVAPQPLPAVGGEPMSRPPAAVAGTPPSGDVTGTVRGPGARPQDRATVIAALPPEDRPEQGPTRPLPPQFRRQLVTYPTPEPAGTIIIDTPHTYLYLMLGNGKALRYGIGVGRDGFTWAGTERITRMSEWPDWHPPKEMIERQPYLPRFMAGGEGNPLGARALYLGNTLYRIHGTNQPSTIGSFVSSGCIRLTNEDIEDLYSRVGVGTRVVVLPGSPPAAATARAPVTR